MTPQSLARDPAVSTWLKTTLASMLRRDPLDAYNDALILARLAKDVLLEAGIDPGKVEV